MIVERHLVWTLPKPAVALDSWRRVAPTGRLVLLESAWGGAADGPEAVLARARQGLRTLRRTPRIITASTPTRCVKRSRWPGGTSPERLIELVEAGGWGPAALYRLRDVEWAMELALRVPERLLGVTPRFAVVAGR